MKIKNGAEKDYKLGINKRIIYQVAETINILDLFLTFEIKHYSTYIIHRFTYIQYIYKKYTYTTRYCANKLIYIYMKIYKERFITTKNKIKNF